MPNKHFFLTVYRKQPHRVNGGSGGGLNRDGARGALFRAKTFAFTLAATLICAAAVQAGDWPQILGPNRNGIADGEQLLAQWPAAGPKVAWHIPVGRGYAGVAIAGGKAIIFDRQEDFEVVSARDPKSGKEQWSAKWPVRFESTIAPDDGPRCVPLIQDDKVVALGAAGTLACFALADGKRLWRRDLLKDFDVPPSYFGVGSSPVAVGGKVLVNVGGRDGAGIVAFDMSDGATVWKATDEGASYSSPTLTRFGGKPLVVFAARLNVVGLDPASGRIAFRIPFGQRGPTVNAATPLVIDGHLFVSASYGVGARWAKLGATDAKVLWESDEVMSSQYTTAVYHAGALFGIHGRQDQPPAHLRCVDPQSQKIYWSEDNFGTANLILAGDKLLIMKSDGELVLAAADKSRYHPLVRAQVLTGIAQPLPALANGRLFIRDETTLKCLVVGE